MSTTEVVIIGGSHAGLGLAKTLIKTLPSAKVTLISTSKDYYFNIAVPRLFACPDQIELDEVLLPIERLFKIHPVSKFEFIHASVTKLDFGLKTVRVDNGKKIKYHYLVIASGSHTLSPTSPWESTYVPFKQPFQDTLRTRIPKIQNDIASALRIVIAGGGPLGIELASEIATQYPDKTITMVFASLRFLEDLKQTASIEAAKKLNRMGINVRSGTKVKNTVYNKENKDWMINLMDGTSIEADLYIPATGVFPNNTFLSPELLSDDGWVNTDDYLHVKNAASVYAVGDIVAGQPKNASVIKSHISVVAHNLSVDITGLGVRRQLKPTPLTGVVVTIGSGGTGQIGKWVPWGWVISWIRGDFMLSKTDMFVSEN